MKFSASQTTSQNRGVHRITDKQFGMYRIFSYFSGVAITVLSKEEETNSSMLLPTVFCWNIVKKKKIPTIS